MVASGPPLLPSGWLSIDDALNLIAGPMFGAEWTGEEHRAAIEVHDMITKAIAKHNDRGRECFAKGKKSPKFKPPSLPPQLKNAASRRSQAFKRLCGLCAYGVVPSALLLDDFTVTRGIPTRNWLDQRMSAEMYSTGRSKVAVDPLETYTHPGWLLIDSEGLRRAVNGFPDAAPRLRSSKRGKRPAQLDRVKEKMRAAIAHGEDIAGMKEEEMKARFDASRDTCRKARKAVLSEIVDNSIRDK
jgi:hypothetical protein